MQFQLTFTLSEPLLLPMGYHSTLQGFIYSLLGQQPAYSAFLHDRGYHADSHSFRGFCYSLITGKYRITSSFITFYHRISFEIRSPLEHFCSILETALMEQEHFYLAGQELFLEKCERTQTVISDDALHIHMLSPMCISQTYLGEDKKKTRYLIPGTTEFETQINHNLSSKKQALLESLPIRPVTITPIHPSESDKYVTKFKNKTYITAYNGTYHLTGDPEDLQFLYDCGIGSRNSQDFGLFHIL